MFSEPVNIDISNLDDLDFNDDWNSKSNHHSGGSGGGSSGIELLMNDKKKENMGNSSYHKNDINIDDLNDLENDLDNLIDETSYGNDRKSSRFDYNSGPSSSSSSSFGLGAATGETEKDQTWDGYGKFNNIPMNPDLPTPSSSSPLSKEELLKQKFKLLRQLEALEAKGVTLTKKYSMESPLLEMQSEYDIICDEKFKDNAIKFQGNMLMACVNGIEFLNNKFDPFDLKLDGWSDQVTENLSDYDTVFEELYIKYKAKGSIYPELKLLFTLGGSAAMVHMTNTYFKSQLPGMDAIFKQRPDLLQELQKATLNTMGQNGNPGFSNFMSGVTHQDRNGPMPPPFQTRNSNQNPYSQDRPGNNSSYASTRPSPPQPPSNPNKTSRPRTEMRGPSDLSDLLPGLKTKTINIPPYPSPPPPQSYSNNYNNLMNTNLDLDLDDINEINTNTNTNNNNNDSSTISIAELKDLQSNSGNFPKKSKRKRSDKSLNLDI